MSRHAAGVSQADELKELAQMLAVLWETARRLPEGPERQIAFTQIEGFRRRLAALAARLA